jgi:DNA-binding MarR family transcriptional regulator
VKPLDVFNYYNGSGVYPGSCLDLIGDQILEYLCQYKDIRTQLFVNSCYSCGLSSPATTYAKLEQMEEQGLILKIIDKNDTRVRLLMATEKGRNRIKNWGKK